MAFGGALTLSIVHRPLAERAAERLLAVQVRRDLATRPGEDPRAMLDQLARTLPAGTRELKVVRPGRLGQSADSAVVAPSPVYQALLDRLLQEARWFSACNLVLFALTALLAGARRAQAPYLVLPAAILAGATVLAVIGYFFAEDWLLAFVTGGFAGWGYLLMVAAVAALLGDIAFNRARVSGILARVLWHWQP